MNYFHKYRSKFFRSLLVSLIAAFFYRSDYTIRASFERAVLFLAQKSTFYANAFIRIETKKRFDPLNGDVAKWETVA